MVDLVDSPQTLDHGVEEACVPTVPQPPAPCQGGRPPCGIYLRVTWFFGWTRSLSYPLGVVVLSGTVAGGRAWGGNDEGDLRCSVCYIVIRPFPRTQSHVFEEGFPACGAREGWLTTPLFVAQSATASV